MRRFVLALQFLTRLPLPNVRATPEDFARSMRWFPAVGLVIGAIVAAGTWIFAKIDPWSGALAGLLLWVGVTGALHLDGLSDLADARGAAHKDRARLLTVLADPHVGSFGVVAIGLQLLAKLVLLHGLILAGGWPTLLLVPFAARIGPLAWTRWLPPLHAGLAARFADVVRVRDLVGWGALLAAAAVAAPALLVAPLLVALWGRWVRQNIGGISGDGHGAGIELVESGLLAVVVIAGRMLG